MKFKLFLENKRCANLQKEIEPIFDNSWAAYWKNTLKSDNKKTIINNIEKLLPFLTKDEIIKQSVFQWENPDMIKWVVNNLEFCKKTQ